MSARLALILALAVPSLAQTNSWSAPPASAQRQPIATPAPRAVSVGSVSLASDGNGFLAVWSDSRFGDDDVVAARFDSRGRSSGLPFPVFATWRSESAELVWDGRSYTALAAGDLMGSFAFRVHDDDTVGGTREVAGWQASLSPRGFVSNGSRYAMFVREQGVIQMVILDSTFARAGAAPIGREPTTTIVDAASDGTGFLVLWADSAPTTRTLIAQRFDAAGAAVGPREIVAAEDSSAEFHATVAAHDSGYTIFWREEAPVERLVGLRLGAQDEPPRRFIVADGEIRRPAAAWDGRSLVVLWSNTGGRHGASVASTGEVLRVFTVDTTAGYAGVPAIASNGDVFLALWNGTRYVIDPAANEPVLEHEAETVRQYVRQEDPVIARAAGGSITAWKEGGALYVTRIDRAGRRLDDSGIRIAAAEWGEIALGCGGDVCLVVWSANGMLRGARIDWSGTVLDPGGFEIYRGGLLPIVAGSENDLRVVWTSSRQWSGSPAANLETARISRTGPPSVQISLVERASYDQWPAALLSTEEGYVIVWQQATAPPCYRWCPPAVTDHWLGVIGSEGSSVGERVVLRGAQSRASAAATTAGIVLVYSEDGFVHTLQVDRRGAVLGAPVSIELPRVYRALVAETDGGVAVVARDTLIHLDETGAPRSAPMKIVGGDDTPTPTSLAFDGTSLWVAYTALWTPLPEAHPGTVMRSYLLRLGHRPRGVRH